MGIKLKNGNNNLDLATKIQAVIVEGGYYTPEVDEEGNLSWIPSGKNMEAVDTVNIMGPAGAPGKDGEPGVDGESGVYVGNTEPTDDSLVWINPEGEATEDSLATEAYVDNKVADLASESYVAETIAAQGFQTEAQVKDLINSALEEVENGSY